jgi:Ca2+-binding EF-hand superfamily protein
LRLEEFDAKTGLVECVLVFLHNRFARLDVNGDGSLSREELQVLTDDGVLSLQACNAMMYMGDSDHDGQISLGEFLELGQALRENTLLKAQLFSILGGSPRTPAETLRAKLQRLTVKELRVRAKTKGASLDQLEDVANSDEPKTKLVELLLELEEPGAVKGDDPATEIKQWLSRLKDLHSTFSRLDVNGDGSLSRKELQVLTDDGALSLQACNAMMYMGDGDHDGQISLGEFLELGEALREVEQLKIDLGV